MQNRLVSFAMSMTVAAATVPMTFAGARGTATTAPAVSKLAEYENAEHGFKLSRPEAWENMRPGRPPMVAMFLHVDGNADGVADTLTVSVSPPPDGVKPDNLADEAVNALKADYADFKLIENRSSTVCGKPSRSLLFTGKFGNNVAVEVRLVLCFSGGNIYRLMIETVPSKYHELEPTFNAIIKSFQFIDKAH